MRLRLKNHLDEIVNWLDKGRSVGWIAGRLYCNPCSLSHFLVQQGIRRKKRSIIHNQIDWSLNDYQLSKLTGFTRSTFAHLRRIHGIPFGQRINKGAEWGAEIEKWAQEHLLPASFNLNEISKIAPFDLFDPVYHCINVKSATAVAGAYCFSFKHHFCTHRCDYYLCLGLNDLRIPEVAYLIPATDVRLPLTNVKIACSGKGKYEGYRVPLAILYKREAVKKSCS